MTVFKAALKRMAKQPLNWAFILVFPMISVFLITTSANQQGASADSIVTYFGVVDQDNTALSEALVQQLKTRYNILAFEEADIPAALTDADVPWILLIRPGYADDILSGRAPGLEGYSLTVSDTSALGSVNAQNITRALLLLGTDDLAAIEAWREASKVDTEYLEADSWAMISFWFAFFGFVSLFTAYFVVKSLLDDKRGGMPDRLGVLPQKPRTLLAQGALAAFLMTEISAVLLLTLPQLMYGVIPNAGFLFGLLSLYNLFSVSMVLAITSLARDLGAASVIMTMLATFFSMLGGLFWPLDLVPEFMQRLAWFSPGYWLARGLQNIEEITFTGYGMPLLFLFGFSAVSVLLGGWKNIQRMED